MLRLLDRHGLVSVASSSLLYTVRSKGDPGVRRSDHPRESPSWDGVGGHPAGRPETEQTHRDGHCSGPTLGVDDPGFGVDDIHAVALAEALKGVLDKPGWYADFHNEREIFVVFPGRVFRYSRGDKAGRSEAQAYGRGLGVPEPQLDWAD
jgi:hypothetical protein